MESHYEVLGVSTEADRDEVRRAYRALLKDHHPDHGGSRERFLRIKEAYEAITGETAPSDRETDGGAVPRTIGRDDPTFDPDDRGRGEPNRGLTVEGEYLTLTLSGLVQEMALESIVGDYALNSNAKRPVAFFEAYNPSDRVLTWRGKANTSFIGDDGFMYEGSNVVAPHADKLPGRWSATEVEVPPGRALNAIVVAQEPSNGVEIGKVIYTQHARDASGESIEDTERYLFEIRPGVRRSLDDPPIDLE